MKIISWNVNGFRAVVARGFWDWFKQQEGDVVCLQEVKAHPEQVEDELARFDGWQVLWNQSKTKKGYSGTASICRHRPLSFRYGFPDKSFQGEGRLILLEYPSFYLFNVYFPNGQMNQERLQFKLGYYDRFLEYAQELRRVKPIVVCGDFNTAHKEIDLKNPTSNAKRSGFLPVERAWIDSFIDHGYVDTFRMFNQEPEQYSWWSYRFNARSKNVGWRIDYFFVSSELKDRVMGAWIDSDVMGSDHCPVGVELDVD